MSIFGIYVVGSVILSVVAISNTYSSYEQFYQMVEHLTSSKPHKTVILNAIFAIFVFFLDATMKFFFGEIREIERIVICSFKLNFTYKLQHTIEKVKRKIIEFALMLIVFKDDILDQVFLGTSYFLVLYTNVYFHFVAYFVGLMSLSVVHWIAIKRSEFVHIILEKGIYLCMFYISW